MEYLSAENVIAAVVLGGTVLAGGLGLWNTQRVEEPAVVATPSEKEEPSSRKASKKAAAPSKAAASVKEAITSIPGQFDLSTSTVAEQPLASSTSSVKSKKKKGSKAKKAAPQSVATESETEPAAPAVQSVSAESKKAAPSKKSSSNVAKSGLQHSVIDTDNEWTRVEASSKNKRREEAASTTGSGDTNTDEDGPAGPRGGVDDARRPLAERLLPKARKTGVEDMLDTPDHPSVSRVMRVSNPAEQTPAPGFSWGDYEDAHTEEDGDGDDEGWGVVKSRGGRRNASSTASLPSKATQSKASTDAATKKQRQNAKKREAEKAAKADAEAQRQATLRQHQREVEKARVASQASSSKGKVSGGMTATVSDTGKLVWE